MLSYSTGISGTGADVDRVRQATQLVQRRAPDLPVDGPLQHDAAVDPTVGSRKGPGSVVAGRATVLIFPDLDTGNNLYKAVQRSSGAMGDRSGAARAQSAGQRPIARRIRGRHRQHCGDYRYPSTKRALTAAMFSL